MEFYTTIEIVDRRYSKWVKAILGIICLLDIAVMIIGGIIDKSVDFLFIIPLIFLVPAFLKTGVKYYYKDVPAVLNKDSSFVILSIPDVVLEKKNSYNREYRLQEDDIKFIWNEEKHLLDIIGTGNVQMIDRSGKTAYEQAFKNEIIELSIKEQTYKEIVEFIK